VAVNNRHGFEEGILGMRFPKIGKKYAFLIIRKTSKVCLKNIQNDQKQFQVHTP
jgi:uncharacterized UPF0160 family protein